MTATAAERRSAIASESISPLAAWGMGKSSSASDGFMPSFVMACEVNGREVGECEVGLLTTRVWLRRRGDVVSGQGREVCARTGCDRRDVTT